MEILSFPYIIEMLATTVLTKNCCFTLEFYSNKSIKSLAFDLYFKYVVDYRKSRKRNNSKKCHFHHCATASHRHFNPSSMLDVCHMNLV